MDRKYKTVHMRGRRIERESSVRKRRGSKSCHSGSPCCLCNGSSRSKTPNSKENIKKKKRRQASRSCSTVKCCPCKVSLTDTTQLRPVTFTTTNSKAAPLTTTNSKATPLTTTNSKATPLTTTNSKATPLTTTNSKATPLTTTNSKAIPLTTTNSRPGALCTTHLRPVTLTTTNSLPGTFGKADPQLGYNNGGRIAGGVVGTLLVIGLGALILAICWRKRRGIQKESKEGVKNPAHENPVKQPIYNTIDDAAPKYEKLNGQYGSKHVYASRRPDASPVDEMDYGLNSGRLQNCLDAYNHLNVMNTTKGASEARFDSGGLYSELDDNYGHTDQTDGGYFVLEKETNGTETHNPTNISQDMPDNAYFVLEKDPAAPHQNPRVNNEYLEKNSNNYFVLETVTDKTQVYGNPKTNTIGHGSSE